MKGSFFSTPCAGIQYFSHPTNKGGIKKIKGFFSTPCIGKFVQCVFCMCTTHSHPTNKRWMQNGSSADL